MNETTLQDLLLKARDAGMSYRAMEEKVERAERRNPRGMKISRATANNIVLGRQRSPVTDEVIRAVACIADVPEHVAFTAAGRRTNGSPFADELPAGVDDLDPRERRVALDLLRVLIAQRQELNQHAAEPADDTADPPTAPRAQGTENQKIVMDLPLDVARQRVAGHLATRFDVNTRDLITAFVAYDLASTTLADLAGAPGSGQFQPMMLWSIGQIRLPETEQKKLLKFWSKRTNLQHLDPVSSEIFASALAGNVPAEVPHLSPADRFEIQTAEGILQRRLRPEPPANLELIATAGQRLRRPDSTAADAARVAISLHDQFGVDPVLAFEYVVESFDGTTLDHMLDKPDSTFNRYVGWKLGYLTPVSEEERQQFESADAEKDFQRDQVLLQGLTDGGIAGARATSDDWPLWDPNKKTPYKSGIDWTNRTLTLSSIAGHYTVGDLLDEVAGMSDQELAEVARPGTWIDAYLADVRPELINRDYNVSNPGVDPALWDKFIDSVAEYDESVRRWNIANAAAGDVHAGVIRMLTNVVIVSDRLNRVIDYAQELEPVGALVGWFEPHFGAAWEAIASFDHPDLDVDRAFIDAALRSVRSTEERLFGIRSVLTAAADLVAATDAIHAYDHEVWASGTVDYVKYADLSEHVIAAALPTIADQHGRGLANDVVDRLQSSLDVLNGADDVDPRVAKTIARLEKVIEVAKEAAAGLDSTDVQGDYALVARTRDPRFQPQDPDAYRTPDLPPDDDGPEFGA
ncbi:hypothetical protein JVX90_13910 [Gordonia sp. PDNC005]|uniref:hypothetical protein n=1 Tax=Gordonia sp. PDNC005 TaxID=2811424 RepID=UPI00196236FB|nr:hypothetical protein [Gordonia sp. PDNC005]QRY61508.1 hypothetical protein JVX90_13910 [Gordonia sp. PDNC005]